MNDINNDNCLAYVKKLLLALAAVVLVYLFVSSCSTLWDRDEPRFARATYEMVESGNYLYPTFNGELRPDKPIMIYWLMSIPVRIFSFLGPNAFPARFIAAFGSAFSCLFTFFIAKRLFDLRTAFAALAILASSLLILMMGTFATADSILLPAMLAVLLIFFRAVDKGRMGVVDTILMSAAFGFALLAKGPVGYLPALVIFVTLILIRKEGVKFLPVFAPTLLAMLLAAGIFLLWAIPANNATNGEFYRLGIGKHVVGRSTSAMESHGGNFFLYLPYYLVVTIMTFFPWTLHLPAAISCSIGNRLDGVKGKRLVYGWVLPVLILMTLVATKLPHYIIMAFPALAIVTAAFICGHHGEMTVWDRKWLRGGIWFFGTINVGFAVVAAAAPFFLKAGPVCCIAGCVTAVIVIYGGLQVNRYQLREDVKRSTYALVRTLIPAMAVVLCLLLPGIDRTKIPPRIAASINKSVSHDVPVGFCGFKEPTINFYLGRHVETLANVEVAAQWFAQKANAVLIIPEKQYLLIKDKLVDSEIMDSVSGINYSKMDDINILVIKKKLPE